MNGHTPKRKTSADDSAEVDSPAKSQSPPLAKPIGPLPPAQAAAYIAATLRPNERDRSITPATVLNTADWYDAVRKRLASEAEQRGEADSA